MQLFNRGKISNINDVWYNKLMAEHMVPQDVEADDKLIGPFSFRQFVYLMIAAGAGFLAFALGKLAIPLALIPAPMFVFFLVIALPLRKDQPTEIYLAAVVRYWLKTRIRMWQADGEQPLVEISAPIVDDSPKTKDLAGDEVSRRLSFLANLSDTQGWSARGIQMPVNNTNLTDEFAADAVNAPDTMTDSRLSDSIGTMLDKSDQKIRNNAVNRMRQAAQLQSATPPVKMAQSQLATPQLVAAPPMPTSTQSVQVTPQPAAQVTYRPVQQPVSTQSSLSAPTATTAPTSVATPALPRNPQSVVKPVQAVTPAAPATSTAPVTPATSPIVAAPQPQPKPQPVTLPAKPAIIEGSEAKPKPQPADDAIIDIKLH